MLGGDVSKLWYHVEQFQNGIPPTFHHPLHPAFHSIPSTGLPAVLRRAAGEKLGQLREDLMHPLQPQQHSRQVVSRLLAFSRKAFEHVNWIAAGTF